MFQGFRKTCFAVALTLVPLTAHAGLGPLIDAEDLKTALENEQPIVLDIRTGAAYEAGHIPGSRPAPYGLFRGGPDNPGELVPEDQLTEVLRELGITTDQPVVIVHQGSDQTDFGAAARVYWTLKSSGVSDLAILNGGMNGWQQAGQSVDTGSGPTVAPSTITARYDPTWLATREDVKAIIDGEDSAELIDARPEAFWKGETKHGAAERPGTLPQSRYFTHDRWFGGDEPALIKPDLVRQLAAENGFEQGDRLVSFCNTGHWAATNWFALSEIAGIEGVRLYPESMVGWSQSGYEMANVPGLFRNMLNKITGKY
ncbi:thiosulfate/3-mercaptopyruvate sulfurtransferase [Roseovarius azorensis]|uniref:Thiosulfate/3-mercaptopyruvate sulfurtransferase n=1 Tax=Roseovarius azorensis TaxID=1287727 RepID=A0A1H7VJH2_9RHOB|nr:rhodanese-like domain-containing protein [Roseovarius azorensis]SEM09330.1 thiosulfate/3-mercaptopyruvate sulfurtransferase [Roseovarius azorensis]